MSAFVWMEFYSEFATSLLKYAEDRASLIEKIKQIYVNAKMKLPTLERENNIVDIDPFTVFGLFNKGITTHNRIAILNQIKKHFNISAAVPTNFDGIPVVNNMMAAFYYFSDQRGERDIDNLWSLFKAAIAFADSGDNEKEFARAFDQTISQQGCGWKITMGLYWIRPMTYISLDSRNRKLLENNQGRFKPDMDVAKLFKYTISAENYLVLRDKVKAILTEYKTFPELSYAAWKASTNDGAVFCGEEKMMDIPMNTILYGPPGTGKTHNTVVYAVAIIEHKRLADVEHERYSDLLKRYETYKADGRIEFTTFHQSYGYEEFIEGIKPVMDNTDENRGDIRYSIEDGLFKAFCNKAAKVQIDEKKNHVFIIDEINRGNISKIFGELITLIESSKRIGQPEGMRAKLPYSQQLFGVPNNVYIIGTMNTADRSIATIDTALRRRFSFKEMMPDADVLKGISVEDISVSEMLARMNKRISVLYDREHTIGHAYFIPLRDNPTIEQLAEIFENAIVPLLQEYFYEDYEKIRLVLGDNNKDNEEEQFIVVVENDYNELFGSADIGFDDSVTYEINRAAFDNIEAYRSI